MAQSSVRGEGIRPRVREAGEPGWNDGLYDENGDPVHRTGGGRVRTADGVRVRTADDGRVGTPDGGRVTTADGDGGRPADDTLPPTQQAHGRHGGRWDGGGGRRPRRRRRILRWSAMVLAFLILGAAGAGYIYYRHLNDNIKKDALNIGDAKDRAAAPKPNAAGQTPLNILLIGSDARDSVENQKLGGAKDTFGAPPRADVQMLLHVSADRTNMSVVSMPRDTLLQIPTCTDPDTDKDYAASTSLVMTNDSLGRGGPGCTVATWEKLTDIHIDHFMMVDFAGVVSMADAIGGVPVCVDANIYSHTSDGHGSGLRLEKGTTSIQGKQALQWLRTRYGFEDGSDIGRAEAQHMYMNSMVRQLRENATLSNPNKLRKLAETATSALTVDEGLGSVTQLYDLSKELKKVPTDRITMTTMPWVYSSDGNRVLPKPTDAAKLFRLVREDIALDGKDKKKTAKEKTSSDPAAEDDKIGVIVQNGTRTSTLAAAAGRASTVTQLLIGKGFTQATADTASALTEDTTVIRYPSADFEGDALRVAKALGIPARSVEKSTDVSGVTLIVGADWRDGTTYKPAKDDDKTPESADALNGSDTSACMHVNPNFTW
ncbi:MULTISPECIES: LCP family protein [Streptomyces]|uniref:LytR family transcriptional regulator n=1 Tax=Streptomyces dengpaensis TaxID=2049881 RepID=A0ABN5I5J0_9ACTN|nr:MULTISPECIES: LCP family protein [Streptomyces]AVH58329.1 LytR family transcriptional regulator [Streptomyces dengpaensis]PIB07983.1 transcriptional regulator [Streptomyces sp. HG99]